MIGMIARPSLELYPTNYTGDPAWAAEFPKSNMTNNDYGRVARTVAALAGAGYSATLDIGNEPRPQVDAVAVLWHNLRAGDSILVGAGGTMADAWNGVGYSSGILPAITGTSKRDGQLVTLKKFLLTIDPPQTWPYWSVRFIIGPTNHPDGYVQVSRVALCKRALFQIGPQKAELGAVDLNQKVQLETGDERSTEDQLLVRPTAKLDLSYAKESEMADVLGQYTLGLGVSRPMLICPDITATNLQDTIVFGRPEQVVALQSEIYDVWKFQAAVKSIGP